MLHTTAITKRVAIAGAPCVLVWMLVLTVAVPLSAQTVTPGPDGTISVHAEQVPLATLLRAVAAIAPFEKLSVDPAVESTPVTVVITGAAIRTAIASLLEAAGSVDYVLSASPDSRRLRLVVVRTRGGDHLRAAQTPARSPVDVADTASNGADAITKKAALEEQPVTEAADEVADNVARQTVTYLNAVLAQPPAPRKPGTVVDLPFTDGNGAPMKAVVSPAGAALPAGLPSRALPTAPPAPPTSDPDRQAMYDVLLRTRKPGG